MDNSTEGTRKAIGLRTHADLDFAITTLLIVRDQAKSGKYHEETAGLCLQWHAVMCTRLRDRPSWSWSASPYQMVSYLARSWKHSRHPGRNAAFPVPDVRGYDEWIGPNLVLRLDLIRHILKRLRDLRRWTPVPLSKD